MKLKNPLSFLKRNFWDIIVVLILLALSIFIASKNYVPGTWLLGWDDLVPELNFKLNIARSLSVAWQEYQGLGLLGGMAHAADLPRQVFLLISSLFLPTSFLRYFWTFLMLCVGPIGVYWLVSRVLSRNSPTALPPANKLGAPSVVPPVARHPFQTLAGFSAAIFYLFNLATVQIFYTPFETFVSFYGLVPWLLFFALDYFKNGGKKRLFTFFIISILSTGAFYVQTLFVVYAVFLSIFALETIAKEKLTGLFRSVSLALVTLLANAFWLIPVLYFSLTGASIPANSHINSIATPETQFMNLARTNFVDIATLKGYWFDYFDWNKAGTYDYLYKTWINYSNQPFVVIVSMTLFIFSVLGLILSIFKKKTSFGISFLILLVISYFMLNGGTISFIPLFSEIFRNAFTKWSNAMALVSSVGLGYLVFIVSDVFKNKRRYVVSVLGTLLIILASLFTVWPILQGNLVADSMRVNLPSYYFDTINYFKTQDSTKRIVDFPLTDFWGWKFYDWGYRGSGFLWYGISQPILDRAFDVWSPNNEAFYKEISHAVEALDQNELKYVLNKYQVSYILFDESIYEPGNTDSAVKIQKEKSFLESSSFISKAKVFGKVTVYQTALENISSFVSAPQSDLSLPFISVGQKGNVAVKEVFPSPQGYQEAKNCDVRDRGSVTRDRTDVGNYYGATNDGVSCDYFYYPKLDLSQAYEMRITGKNISGRSLKIYLYNAKTKTVDLQELLPAGDFDKSFLILPASPSQGGPTEGYTLSVETRSFGKEKSENLITGIEFSPVATTVQGATLQGASFKGIQNNLKIVSVKKFGTWFYKVDVQGNGLMQLGQGFEKGWVAISPLKCLVGSWSKLEHIKVNNWANGWIIGQELVGDGQSWSKVGNQNTNGEADKLGQTSTIYLIYWPQFLQIP